MSSIPSHAGNYDSSDSVDPRQHMAAATVAPASAVGASTSRPRARPSGPRLGGRRRPPGAPGGAGLGAPRPRPPRLGGLRRLLLPRETGPPGPYLGGSRWSGSPAHVGASTRHAADQRRSPSAVLQPRAIGFADASSPLGGRLLAEPPTGSSRRPGAFGRRPPTGARAAAGPAQSSDDRRASCLLHADCALLCARATLRGRGAPAVAPAPASGRAHRRRHSSSPMALSRPSIRAAGTHHSSDPTGAPQRLSALDRPPEAYPSGPCQRCGLAGPPILHPHVIVRRDICASRRRSLERHPAAHIALSLHHWALSLGTPSGGSSGRWPQRLASSRRRLLRPSPSSVR